MIIHQQDRSLVVLELFKKKIRVKSNIIINVYTNASGFLWDLCKTDSGTDLGYSDDNGDCKISGSWKTYEACLENAIQLINQCDLKQFKKAIKPSKFHWGNYAGHIIKTYTPSVKPLVDTEVINKLKLKI